MDVETKARERVTALAERDPFVRSLGIRCIDAGYGRAAVAMTVGAQHLNFNGTCHGGVLFALADTAFGLASNSHGSLSAGIDAHMTFSLAVQAGETLEARAVEISRSRKLGVYRVDVVRGDQLVAAFTGTVYVSSLPHGDAG
ncbi:MAG TPA: hotdog fold thioesterase [Pelomicrobium sp.]|nr:hotdog fold thioesterase [Pelomicrobium sp.]